MQFCLISDLHFGARNDSPVFDEFFRRFYTECFFPYLQKNNIKTIVILGDVFDRRKLIYIKTLHSCREYFFDVARDLGIQIHIIAGNHDVTYKNTNVVNSIELLLKAYDNIEVIVHPKVSNFDGTDIQMMPWICSDNYDESMNALKNTTADIVFGHFEIEGFPKHKGDTSHLLKYEKINNELEKLNVDFKIECNSDVNKLSKFVSSRIEILGT